MAHAVSRGDPEQFSLDQLYFPATDRTIRRLPRLLLGALRLVWRSSPRCLSGTVALQVIASVALASQVLVGKLLLSRLLADDSSKNFSSTLPLVVELGAVLAISAVAALLRTELQRLLGELVARSAMKQVITAANSADLLRFEHPRFHDRLQRAIVNATIRPLQMTNGLLAVAGSLLSAAAVGAVLATIEPLFALLGVLAAIPVTFSSLKVGRALYSFAVAQTPMDRERTYLQHLLVEKEPAKEIRAYGLDPYLSQRFDALYERRIRALRELIKKRALQGSLGGVITAIVSGGVLALLISFVGDGRVSLAGAGAAAAALILLGTQLQTLAGGLGTLYESALFVQDFDDFVVHMPRGRQFLGTAPAPSRIGTVRAHNLTFTYPSRSEQSLCNVSLEIEPGQVVALVGMNGSGKTTLAKILAGLYPPDTGCVTWDGQDVAGLDIAAVRSRVAVLFQDFVRYYLSARENIGMGRWERLDDEAGIHEAARSAGADGILAGLPSGYETYLGPQFFAGSDLSGGQWQRVALARAFFRAAELIILDEPTAALDPRAEAALFAAVRDLFAGRSVLLISHRFASVRLADLIYVLDAGRVVERGSHEELMNQGGLYADLFTLQAEAFGLESP